MYETPAALEIHSGLHFARERRMYGLHFVEENNILVWDPKNHLSDIFLYIKWYNLTSVYHIVLILLFIIYVFFFLYETDKKTTFFASLSTLFGLFRLFTLWYTLCIKWKNEDTLCSHKQGVQKPSVSDFY